MDALIVAPAAVGASLLARHLMQWGARTCIVPDAALAEVKELQTILPICMYCRKIRDDENYWHSVEAYIAHHTNTKFSHGICPSCYRTVVEPQFKKRE